MEGIPKNVKKKLYATKIVWPNPPEFNQENIHSDTVVSRFTKIDEGDKITINSWYPIVIAHGSGLDASWPSITYNSWSRVILPHPWYKLPYMAVYSYLWYKKDENSSPALVAMKAVNGTNVYQVEAKDTYNANKAGYYCTTGGHYEQAPPGYEPPEQWTYTQTSWKYVGS